MARKKMKRKTPAHLMTTSLRPRIDLAWRGQVLTRQSQATILATFDDLARGVKKDFFMATVLRAFVEARTATQEHLRDLLPIWLKDRGYLDVLKGVVTNSALEFDMQDQALIWLEVAGVDLSTLNIPKPEDLFFDAYLGNEGSQRNLVILWYTNRHRKRVNGLAFLIDENPPWQGAIKDVMRYPTCLSNQVIEQFIDRWNEEMADMRLAQISAEEAKDKLLEALKANKDFNIRLPRNLISKSDYFAKNVMVWLRALGSSFTMKKFRQLSQKGTTPESIINFQQQIGRFMRLENGQEAVKIVSLGEDDY